jgi:hypothetical protein
MRPAEFEAALAAMREELRKEIEELRSRVDGLATNTESVMHATSVLADRVAHVEGSLEGEDDLLSEVASRVEGLTTKVEGRNRSAPTKRNMTDSDARRVLDGDLKDLKHKEAGEAAGLTYAQVYSCRGGYTFKHVHKQLKELGWRDPWAKTGPGGSVGGSGTARS